MDPAKYAELFLEESREHLTTVNQQLLAWERQPDATEPVAAIFRAVHNIKGMAATMGYATVATLAHRVENVLDLLRRGGEPAAPQVLELLFRSADALEESIETTVKQGKEAAADSDLMAALDAVAEALGGDRPSRGDDRPSLPEIAVPGGAGREVHVVIRPDSALKGARALVVLGRAEAMGSVTGVQPSITAIESEGFDGQFRFRIVTDLPDDRLESDLRAMGDVAEVNVGEAAATGSAAEPAPPAATRHIRVDLRRLDNLMNLIGELVTARGRLEEISAAQADPDLEDVVLRLSHLTRSLQDEIIEARMTPAWQVFDRFPRLVRDVARKLGKRVRFEVEGKEIELDRAILDEIGDPLVHLLRNAVDHGLESPEERRATGKSEEGRLTLSAIRERSSVVIRVTDDGRGIDRDKILAQAKQRGMVEAETEFLRDDEVLEIIARPGYSTATSVSDVSGRGVGIDVVTSRLGALGGSLDLRTTVGKGTAFTMRLPPTLAILPALLAHVADERYALPLTHVEETIDLERRTVTEIDGTETIVVREQVVPLVYLRKLVLLDGAPPPRQPVIILQIGDRRTGLVVDELGGQREIVVKSFTPPRGTVRIFSGVTVLGDGHAVFILDAARLS